MSDTLTTQTLTVTIPVPLNRALSPNARGHWSAKARATQAARAATRYAFRAVLDLNDPGACFQRARWPLTLDWEIGLAKGQRRQDDTNAIASLKAYEDGVASAIGMDDRDFRFGSIRQTRDPEGLGFVRVTITEAEA
jgi:hypothetical protein